MQHAFQPAYYVKWIFVRVWWRNMTIIPHRCPPAAASYSQLSNSREQFWVSRGKLLKSMEQRAVTVILEESDGQPTMGTPRQQAWTMVQTADYTTILCMPDTLWWNSCLWQGHIANISVGTWYDEGLQTEWRDRFQSPVSGWLDGFTHSSALSRKNK